MTTSATAESRPLRFRISELKDPSLLLATGFGAGLLRPGPGTWGSVLGLALWWWLLAPYSPVVQLAAIVVLFVVGLLVCRQVERRYGVHDPGAIVIDEIVGLWIALLGFGRHWPFALLGFALFRLFDISKPGVVRWADRQLTGGLGVMFDDVLAGCLAALGTQFAFWLWWFTAAGGFS